MSLRKVKRSDLVGKTVKSFNHSGVNVLKLTFTDGTKLELWADDAVSSQYGSIPGIFVDEPAKKTVAKKTKKS